jgi:phage tail-like protein
LKKEIVAIAVIAIVCSMLAVSTMFAQAPIGSRPEPLALYRFLVEIDGITQASFMELEGLNVTVDVVEYREGGDSSAPMLIPGLVHYGPLVLKNGVGQTNELLEWLEKTASGNVDRRSLSVIILSANGVEVARYNAWNAWPSSWRLGPLDSLGVGTLFEELVIQYEGFERVMP